MANSFLLGFLRGGKKPTIPALIKRADCLWSLYYRVVVILVPLQGLLCYTVRDVVDWFTSLTARRFKKGSDHSPLQFC